MIQSSQKEIFTFEQSIENKIESFNLPRETKLSKLNKIDGWEKKLKIGTKWIKLKIGTKIENWDKIKDWDKIMDKLRQN